MKKLMIAMVAVALATVANAESVYKWEASAFVNPYSAKDPNPGEAHESWYSCYAMTQGTARDITGYSSVTCTTMAEWLNAQVEAGTFESAMATVIDASERVGDAAGGWVEGWHQYTFTEPSFPKTSGLSDSLGVIFFYDGGWNAGYRVMQSAKDDKFYFDEETSAKTSWTGVTVPEPTSGILLILGVAGLALKRKQK